MIKTKNCIKTSIVVLLFIVASTLSAQDNKKVIADSLQNRAYSIMQKDEYHQAFKLLDSSLRIAKEYNYIKLEARNYNLRGITYMQLSQYNVANQFFSKAIKINDSIDNKVRLIRNYSNLLHSFVLSNNFKAYDSLYLKVVNLQKETNRVIEFYINETELIAEYKRKNFKKVLNVVNNALLRIELPEKQHLFEEAEFNKLLKKRLKLIFLMYQAFALMELNQEPKKALAILTRLENEDLENIMWYDIRLFKNISSIYNYKREYYHSTNQDSSRYYLQKLLKNEKQIVKLLEEKTARTSKFIVDYIDKERALKESEFKNKIQKSELNKSKLTLVFISIMCLALGLLAFLVYRSSRFKASVNKLLKKQNIRLQKSITEKNILEERVKNIQNEINKDLHDNFGNRLAGIESSHEIIKDIVSQDSINVNQLNKFSKSLEKSMKALVQDVRDFIWSNNSHNNELFKIIDRIETISNNSETAFNVKINVINNAKVNLKMPLFWNRQLILIIKEAINNAVKHSKSKKIDIAIKTCPKGIFELTCEDYGLGFNPKTTSRISGLHNMKVRAQSIGCELTVESKINKGTVILVTGNIPILD